jgi:phage terminase small subunit
MAKVEHVALPYLTKRGRNIFYQILNHIKDAGIDAGIDAIELSMLANSYDAFERAAEFCNKNGFSREIEAKQGSFGQIVPEYSVMKNEYSNILKHSPKYGMTPGDRAKIFGGMKTKKKKDPNEGLE